VTGILLVFCAGLFIGHWTRLTGRAAQLVDRLTWIVVFVLLFILGLSLGRNETFVSHLPRLGLTSLGIAWSCILGSAIVAWLAHRLTDERAS
tara:strand:+ start:1496 stop:1771 length:276 start_codon:yes stop_codon:yes gene_type:complete